MRKRLGLSLAVPGFLLTFLVATPVTAQFGASVGANIYESDEFCLNSEAFLTYAEASYGGDVAGVSASYANSDVPWLPIPGGGGQNLVLPAAASVAAYRVPVGAQQETFFRSQGDAFQASVDIFVIGLARRIARGDEDGGLARIDRIVRPFVSAGVILTTDGDPAPAGDGRQLPTYGQEGYTAPTISYGARVYLPSRESRLGLLIQYRMTHAFVGDVNYVQPDGNTTPAGNETIDWGMLSVGLSFNVGG
jgi:hypothetical protein